MNKSWEYVARPANRKTVKSKWVFKVKRREDKDGQQRRNTDATHVGGRRCLETVEVV